MKYCFILILLGAVCIQLSAQPSPEPPRTRVLAVMNTNDTLDCYLDFYSDKENEQALKFELIKVINKNSTYVNLMAGLYIEKIKEIIIGTEKYFFMDVLKSDGTKAAGCLLKKLYGNSAFALYQWGEKWNAEKAVVLLPKSTDSTLNFTFVNTRRFNNGTSWAIRQFKDCPELNELIRQKTSGWILSDNIPAEERITIWKKYMDKYSSCIKGISKNLPIPLQKERNER